MKYADLIKQRNDFVVNEILKEYVFQTNTPATIHALIANIMGYFKERYPTLDISLRVENINDHEISILPNNLQTYMAFYGDGEEAKFVKSEDFIHTTLENRRYQFNNESRVGTHTD